jgi:hypothetical protein
MGRPYRTSRPNRPEIQLSTSVALPVVFDATCETRPLILERDEVISPCFPLVPASSVPSSLPTPSHPVAAPAHHELCVNRKK